MSIWVGELELSDAPRDLCVPAGHSAARILARAGGKPMGWFGLVSDPNGQTYTPAELQAAITDQLGFELTREVFQREFLSGSSLAARCAPISVVVCTRDRPEDLRACLARLEAVKYPEFEVMVVDNAPKTDEARSIAAACRVRYLREDRPGLNWARNRGVLEARHDLIAFIDDDARADPGWLGSLDRAFADSEVMAVTGLVLPLELDTEAQLYFEQTYGGMGKGFLPKTMHRSSLEARSLLWASGFGVGTNMAFRRALFQAVSLFDVALDVGTATRGGGDVEFMHRTVARGHLLRYEPQAIVWHSHRREFQALKRQIFSNGCCVAPYLFTCLRNKTVPARAVLSYGLREVLGWWFVRRFIRPGRHRRSMVLREFAGLVWGLFAYPLARRDAARWARFPRPICAEEQSEPAVSLAGAKNPCAAGSQTQIGPD